MRIEDCARAMRKLTGEDDQRLRKYLLRRGMLAGRPGALHRACVRAGLCQADVVLALLRLEILGVAEEIVGRPITRCPPALALGYKAVGPSRRLPDERRVTEVRKPESEERGRRRLLSCDMYERIGRARVGMTVAALVARGVTRKDLRIALRRGYLSVEVQQ